MNEIELGPEDDHADTSGPKFPTYFPDNCPPSSSADAEGEVYRIVVSEQLSEADFRSHYELGISSTAPSCKQHGISVFNSVQAARHRQQLSPRLGKFIAKGSLVASAGKVESANKSGHLEWWAYEGIVRSSYFEAGVACH